MFDEGVTTYLGVAAPNFPNLFMLGGPYSLVSTHSSLLSAEFQVSFLNVCLASHHQGLICTYTIYTLITNLLKGAFSFPGELHNELPDAVLPRRDPLRRGAPGRRPSLHEPHGAGTTSLWRENSNLQDFLCCD